MRESLCKRALEADPAARQLFANRLPGSDEVAGRCELSSCNACGCPHTVAAGVARVVYATARGAVVIEVPRYVCCQEKGGCGAKFHAHPLDVNAFPGSPDTAVNLFEPGKVLPVWLDMGLLQQYFHLQFGCPEVSEEGYAQALSRLLVEYREDRQPAVTQKRLQTVLGDVWEEYHIFRVTLDDLAELGCPDYPLSLVCHTHAVNANVCGRCSSFCDKCTDALSCCNDRGW